MSNNTKKLLFLRFVVYSLFWYIIVGGFFNLVLDIIFLQFNVIVFITAIVSFIIYYKIMLIKMRAKL